VNTLFLAYAGASLPLLVLFVSGGDALGTVATAEAVAVEVVRTLCGSVGLIAAVPLTTLLAAGLVLEEPAPGAPAPVDGRVAYSPARGQGAEEAGALFGRVLDLHGSALSAATVTVASGDWLGAGDLPADAHQAATELQRLAASARRQRSASWYRRALEAGRVRLDPGDAGQLDLLRRYGVFSTDTRIWVDGDPTPVVQTTEAFDGRPRAIYRLTGDELERLRAMLTQDGLAGVSLTPRRSRSRAALQHH
jgi:YibE/F-like protein